MSHITIPAAVFESPEYWRLTIAERMFLLDLYIVMDDVERFTIDMARPEDYRQSPGATLARKIVKLLKCGFLVLDGRRDIGGGHYVRIFRFKHSPLGELQQAA